MQVSVEVGDGLERRMTVQVPEEDLSSEIENRLKSLSRTAKLAGFRPGKVPMKVIQRTYGPKVRDEVLNATLQSSFRDAVVQEKLSLAGDPRIEAGDSSQGDGLSYTAIFEIYPEVPAVDASGLSVTRASAEVGEADVDTMIETLRSQRSVWTPVERAAENGDQLIVDFKGLMDGEAFEGGSASQQPVELGKGRLIPGFEDALVGVSAGDERTIDLSFPDNYHAEDLAGKPVQFEVKVHTVNASELPDLNDEFFQGFGVSEGGMQAFRGEVRGNMERELDEAVRAKLKTVVMDALLERMEVPLPKAMVDAEIERLQQQANARMNQQGGGQQLNLPPELFKDEAERRARLGLILAEVVKANEMSADADKVRERVASIAGTYEQPDEVVKWYYSNEQNLGEIESVVLEDQIVDWVMERAQVTEESSTFDAIMNPGQTDSTVE